MLFTVCFPAGTLGSQEQVRRAPSGALMPGLLGLRHGRGALEPHSPAPLRLQGLWLMEVETKLEQPRASPRAQPGQPAPRTFSVAV